MYSHAPNEPVDRHAQLAVRPVQAAQLLSISPRKLWELTKDGEVPHLKLGRATLYRIADLDRWLAELAGGKEQR